MTWNPQERRTETFPIEASRDADGNARAFATFTAWSARDRIGYMDLAARSIRRANDGGRTADVGQLTIAHLARTLTSVEGFGDITYTDPQRGHSVTQPFDPGNPLHLEALSADVLEELIEYAEKVQPTQAARKRAATDPVDEQIPEAPVAGDDEDEGGEHGDPFPTL